MKSFCTKNLLALSIIILFTVYGIAQPTVSFSNANGGTIQEGVGPVNASVNITNPNGNETTVQVTTLGSSTYGSDYTISPQTIVFPAGSSASQPLTISVIDDCIDEGFETIILNLTNPTNGALIGIGQMTITISDNDPTLEENCTYALPSNAIVVDTTMSFFNHNRDFWVCESGNLTLPSSLHVALIESGGIVRSQGNDNEFYVKSGGTVIVDDGESNLIFAEDGATVTIESGTCIVVFSEPGVIFTDNGTETIEEDLNCGPLNINYDSAPANGCVISSTGDEIANLNLEIFPNPTSGRFDVLHSSDHKLLHVEVYDYRGIFLGKLSSSDMKLPDAPGYYIVRLVFEDGVVIRQLVKI